MRHLLRIAVMLALPAAALSGTSAQAAVSATQNVTFLGSILNTCILTVTTPGVLAASSTGTQLSSDVLGGVPAIMAVVSTGARPTLNFSAPNITGPAAWDGSPTVKMSYSSLGGANQIYTTGASSVQASRLLDTFTINARAENNSGFSTGTYTITSTVTCEQP